MHLSHPEKVSLTSLTSLEILRCHSKVAMLCGPENKRVEFGSNTVAAVCLFSNSTKAPCDLTFGLLCPQKRKPGEQVPDVIVAITIHETRVLYRRQKCKGG